MPHMLHDFDGEGSLEVGTPRPKNVPFHFLMNGGGGNGLGEGLVVVVVEVGWGGGEGGLLLMRCRGIKLEHSQMQVDHLFPKPIFIDKSFTFSIFCKHLPSNRQQIPHAGSR